MLYLMLLEHVCSTSSLFPQKSSLIRPCLRISFLDPCNGCKQKREGRHFSPKRSRCFGQTVIPSPSLLKCPVLRSISSLSDETDFLDTFRFLRWNLISLLHEAMGMYSLRRGYFGDNPQCVDSPLPIEHLRGLGVRSGMFEILAR